MFFSRLDALLEFADAGAVGSFTQFQQRQPASRSRQVLVLWQSHFSSHGQDASKILHVRAFCNSCGLHFQVRALACVQLVLRQPCGPALVQGTQQHLRILQFRTFLDFTKGQLARSFEHLLFLDIDSTSSVKTLPHLLQVSAFYRRQQLQLTDQAPASRHLIFLVGLDDRCFCFWHQAQQSLQVSSLDSICHLQEDKDLACLPPFLVAAILRQRNESLALILPPYLLLLLPQPLSRPTEEIGILNTCLFSCQQSPLQLQNVFFHCKPCLRVQCQGHLKLGKPLPHWQHEAFLNLHCDACIYCLAQLLHVAVLCEHLHVLPCFILGFHPITLLFLLHWHQLVDCAVCFQGLLLQRLDDLLLKLLSNPRPTEHLLLQEMQIVF
mmetsp:Transcript_7671/g.18398  ORF Transcript_7671/g.18398 Transcript_7671/m.18398 type:complete len:381 (+) Transcript_7671:760-1902(+)